MPLRKPPTLTNFYACMFCHAPNSTWRAKMACAKSECRAQQLAQKRQRDAERYRRIRERANAVQSASPMAEIAATPRADDAYYAPHSPYEIAVRETEQSSGKPRSDWEHVIAHPLVLQTNRRARHLAGIPEEPSMSPRGMNVTRYHANTSLSNT